MSKQIFKGKVPNELLFNLLNSICQKTEKCFIVSNDAIKKGMFNESISKFSEECKNYYHISKHKYLEKTHTCNSFNTILRQICNFNKIVYTYKIKYINSNYEINYYVYF